MKKIYVLFISIILMVSIVLPCIMIPSNGDLSNKSSLGILTTSKFTRSAPLVLTSNEDIAVAANSGSGTASDPYIIENLLIQSNYTSPGIVFLGTTAHTLLRDVFINESGSGVDGLSIGIQGSANIHVANSSLEEPYLGNFAVILSENITVSNTSMINSNPAQGFYGIILGASKNVLIDNCELVNHTTTSIQLSSDHASNTNITIRDTYSAGWMSGGGGSPRQSVYIAGPSQHEVAIINMTSYLVGDDFYVEHNMGEVQIINCSTSASNDYVIYAENSSNIRVSGGIFDLYNVSQEAFNIEESSNVTIEKIVTLNQSTMPEFRVVESDDVFITGNNLSANSRFMIENTNLTATGNYFDNISVNIHGSNVNFTGNYYRQFFEQNANSTSDLDKKILDSSYNISAMIVDLFPRYHPEWFLRTDTVNLRFYSSVNGDGISFDNLHVYLDGKWIATPSITPAEVLFRLTVQNHEGRVLHDRVHNFNATGDHLNIALDMAARVHFAFYSSFDYIGLDFGLVKFFIDGARITTPSPEMIPCVFNITVLDYADMEILSSTLNLSDTGVYLAIALPVALVTVQNNYNRTVLFKLARGNFTTVYSLASGIQINLRLALGDYTYSVSEIDGTVLKTIPVTLDASRPHEFSVSFGWISVTEPESPIDFDYSLAILAALGIMVALVVISIVFIELRVKRRELPNKQEPGQLENITFIPVNKLKDEKIKT